MAMITKRLNLNFCYINYIKSTNNIPMNRIFILLVLSLFAAGCSPVSVQTQGKVALDPVKMKATYAWLEKAVPSNDIRVNNQDINRLVRNSVEKHLAARGYFRVNPDQADYLVTWFGNIEEEVKEISLASFYNRSGYTGLIGTMPENVKAGKVKKVFARGTLILDILEKQTKNVIWRGSATNTIQEGMSQGRKAQYIDSSVKKILDDLPQR